MFRRILVGDNELVILIRKRRFAGILAPGEYFLFTLGRGIEIERHNTKSLVLCSEWTDTVVRQHPELAARYFTVIETAETQVALVYLDGRLSRVLPPATRVLYIRAAVQVTFVLIDVRAEPEVPARLVATLARLVENRAAFAVIEEGKRGLVYLDGRLLRQLEPGSYAFWNAVQVPRIEVLEMRPQSLDVPGQEILTRDKVMLRVNLSAVYEILDPVTARARVKDVDAHLYRALQIALRQTLSKRSLEEVLAEKADIDETVSSAVRREMQTYGVRVSAIAIKDIILPGDIRDILNQVVTAEKQAQANLIRRREETAATRSLLNTAKLMEDNPLLVRLKELETLEKVAEKVGKLTVYGGVEGLLERTIKMK
jgi:regulator of protease activity HflC (stomatin/prohibitin superfamily)